MWNGFKIPLPFAGVLGLVFPLDQEVVQPFNLGRLGGSRHLLLEQVPVDSDLRVAGMNRKMRGVIAR